jgi:starch synthase (maltosyl-transferring)
MKNTAEKNTVREAPIIYNLFPRLVGPMKDWLPHMERAKNMGFNWIYINPFHFVGFSGSLYSIKDYYDFNPLFLDPDDKRTGVEQLKDVVKKAEELELQLMMDLVINHTAIDSVLIEDHKDWYKQNADGTIKNPGVWEGNRLVTVWGDLAEIDNAASKDLKKLRQYWLDLLHFYIDVGFHGFRCDAAYKVPAKMWDYLITNAKKHNSQTLFFAESLGCEIEDVIKLAKAGFDYTFNSSKWWDFEQPWCLQQYRENSKLAPSISFPESHDCQRLMNDYSGHVDAVKLRYAFASVFSTGLLMPIGFEFGFRKALHVVDTMPTDWETTNIDLSPFISQMNALKLEHIVLKEDNPIETVPTESSQVFAFMKTSHDLTEKALIILNKSSHSWERFYCSNMEKLFKFEGALKDVSIDHPMEYIPNDFEYYLPPCQMRILLCQKTQVDAPTTEVQGE